MRSSRRLLAVPAAVTLAWALAACGGGAAPAAEGSSPAPVETTSAAAAPEAAEITTASFVETISSAQKSAGSYDFTMTMSAAGQAINATGTAQVTDTPQFAMSMEIPGAGVTDIRLVDGVMYMNMGDLTGGKFLQVDPADTSNPMAASIDEMTGDLDPTKSMAGQEAAIASVTKAGEPEQLDGVTAQPYQVVIDPSKLEGPQRDALDQAAAAGVTLPATFEYTFWIGPDDLVRKMTFDLMGSQTEMTFSNWGAAAPVTAPTADQITTEDPFGA
jgi:hypothetical protein